MDKKTVAQMLGVSEKSVSRYAAAGKLPSRYIQGKNGKQLEFNEADVVKFKEDLALPTERAFVKPTLDNHGQDTSDTGTALATLPASNPALLALLAQLQTLGQTAQPNPRHAENAVPVAAKRLLTLDDARALTGLSRQVLKTAIDAGELHAFMVGRAYRMMPDDLDAWLRGIAKAAKQKKK